MIRIAGLPDSRSTSNSSPGQPRVNTQYRMSYACAFSPSMITWASSDPLWTVGWNPWIGAVVSGAATHQDERPGREHSKPHEDSRACGNHSWGYLGSTGLSPSRVTQ